jgi:hypothetical protein
MLHVGRLIPHMHVTTFDGGRFAYADVWQRKNVVVVSLPHQESTANDKYLAQLTSCMSELSGDDTACVITTDDMPDVPAPGVVIADRWGEIHYVTHPNRVEELPGPHEIVEWLRYIRNRCPECEGEAK